VTLDAYSALASRAVVFRRSMTCLSVRGPDRVTWLQGMVSNDVGRLDPGQGCLAAHLSPQGKILALLVVLADADVLWLLAERGREEPVESRPDRLLSRLLIMEDATIEDRSGDYRVFSLVGGGAGGALGALPGGAPGLPRLYDHAGNAGVRAVRTPIGYDLLVPPAEESRVLADLERAGAVVGDEDLRQVVWVERGIPSWGIDLDPGVTLPEIGEDAIDYRKGCYIGQEVVAKVKYIGHVNRRLCGLRFRGDRVPAPGPLRRDDREVGRLTSAVWSPAAGSVIGLGFLKRGAEATGTEVETGEAEPVRGVVCDLPFLSAGA
jgi:folate-binding protein YgfZ